MNMPPLPAILVALCLTTSVCARADIVIGQTNGRSGNQIPFSDVPADHPYPLEYQQIYTHQDFPGITTITSIGFASDIGFSPVTYDLTVGMGTAATTVDAPSVNFADNKSADFTIVQSGLVHTSSGLFDLVIPTKAFTYDPGKGDLLVDIVIHTQPIGGFFNSYNDNFIPDLSRVFTYYGSNRVDVGYGLTTRFGTAVPEPSVVAFFASLGLTGAAFLRRHRAR